MTNPILVEAIRGAVVESVHRGAVAVCDPDGRLVVSIGEVERPVFPRSAIKAFQALPLIEGGGADRYGLTAQELALACASHSGAPIHVETAKGLLAKCGRDESALECGAHWPLGAEAARALAVSGARPSALHNNCSGKHSGFICASCAAGIDPKGYVRPDHAFQRAVKATLEEMTGVALEDGAAAIDGCAIPTYPIPLQALAAGFARFGAGAGLDGARARATARLRDACAAHPDLVAGTDRFDTIVMTALGARAFVKSGAEGVHCAALPELGLGVAIKCDDGAGRAAEVVMATLIARFLALNGEEERALAERRAPTLSNWNGVTVGALRASAALEGEDS
jgi:L-asparaginase II